ncbi:MAG: hypothetical protein GY769_04295 [bacterium]|nr:hypothetical protein [bacterium]
MATRLALAASLILLLGLAWMFRPTVGTSEIVVSEQLSHERLSGIHVIEATGSITAAAVTVETGGDVTFRAGDVVVLSDGFAVGDGASFQIEIAPPAGENNG